ncbi:flagellar motor switch protein FliN [Sphingopyxis yananensis]|uniref:flagellar motor switch protein FliN n=1 Tax=Sphingopyxis yananensis TaxID=2886687 RepID=UPI001D10E6E5|nr:flagellar motor switch protein FliN [Sphingopyxis yananensis]MCC2601466.1 flagellar motor switch protein FliN [Sphingopyxis yananensis]
MSDMSEADAAPARERRDTRNISATPNFDLLAGVSLRVSVEVGSTTMPLSELLSISEGSVIELDRAATELLDIYANGTLIAKGEIVSVDGRYGIKVAELVAPERGWAGVERRG